MELEQGRKVEDDGTRWDPERYSLFGLNQIEFLIIINIDIYSII